MVCLVFGACSFVSRGNAFFWPLMRAMERLTEGKTVIHVTHREETIQTYDRVLVLKEGKLFEKESL